MDQSREAAFVSHIITIGQPPFLRNRTCKIPFYSLSLCSGISRVEISLRLAVKFHYHRKKGCAFSNFGPCTLIS
jgi:hypothetical protein